MSGRAWPVRLGAAAVGCGIGATTWLSYGALALVERDSLMRVGALPSWGCLAGLAGAGAVLLGAAPVRPGLLTPSVLLVLLWLPWLPLKVPSVFLMWEGPLEGAVWVAVAGAMFWRLWTSRGPSAFSGSWSPRASMVVAAVLPAIAYGAAWQMDRARVPAGDEPHYLVITQSLLRDGDLRIENNHQAEQYLEYYDRILEPHSVRRGTDRQIYSIHAQGVPLLVAPAFAIAGYPGAVAMVLAAVGLGLALAWGAAFLLTASSQAAWVGWLAVAASAPLVVHGFTIYPDPVGIAAVMAGVVGLVWLDVTPLMPGRAALVAVGSALAALPWLHTRFAVVAGVLGILLGVRVRARAGAGAVATLFAIPALSAAAWFGFFWRIYGTPNPVAPYGFREGGLAWVPSGIVGLLADQEFGFAANAPVLIAALGGFIPLFRQRPRLAIELLAVVVPYLLATASYPMWWGGYSAPARFAVAVLPVLALPLACWWVTGSRAVRGTILTLGAASAAISWSLVTLGRGEFIFNNQDGRSLLLDWLSPTVDLTLAAPSVIRDGAGIASLDALAWTGAVVLVASAWALIAGVLPGRRLCRAAAIVAAPVAMTVAMPVVWAGRDRQVLTPPTSQMAFLRRWTPEAQPVAVQLRPPRVVTPADAMRLLSLETIARGQRRRADSPLLHVPRVPAGDYDVFVAGNEPLAGTVTVRVGRQDLPIEIWALEGRASGFGGLVLRLPVGVHSIAMAGDDVARRSVTRVALKPRVVKLGGGADALRAARFGHVVVYGLDDYALLEPGALWVVGERTARLVVRADEGAVATLRLRSGAVANEVTLTAGMWTQHLRLAADQWREVVLPPEAMAPAELTVASATGFRPSEYIAGNRDVRWLGVYLTFPGD